MREILFRGKRVDNGQWVEGDLLRAESYLDNIEFTFIFTDAVSFPANEFIGYAEVDPSTIGQYTGLTDKNGVKIFEGGCSLRNRRRAQCTLFLQYHHAKESKRR